MNYPQINARADIKTSPDDFIVNEILGFELTGEGEHLWCYVEKTDMNTSYLERQWAKLLACQRRDISHSGLKDRHARTRQWLCFPAIYADRLPNQGDGWRIVEAKRHQKKLRIGTHKYNEFILTLRNIEGVQNEIETTLNHIRKRGFLNTFGDQRFGHNNLEQAQIWVARQKLPKKREERAQVLSTLRAFLFNKQAYLRAKLGLINQLVIGDRAMLTGSHSHFIVQEVDEALYERLLAGDVTPGGWLIGKEKNPQESTEGTAIIEQALAEHQDIVRYLLEHCDSDWRALSVIPQKFTWQWLSPTDLQLQFMLPKGSFATSLLAQIFHINDKALSD